MQIDLRGDSFDRFFFLEGFDWGKKNGGKKIGKKMDFSERSQGLEFREQTPQNLWREWISFRGTHSCCSSFITSNPIAWHPQYQTVMPLLSIMIYHELSQSTLICDGLWVYFYHDLSYQFKTAFSSCHLPSSSCGLVSDLRVFLDWVRA